MILLYNRNKCISYRAQGSILLVVLLVFMILVALIAVVITGILSRQKSYLTYLNKKRTLYLAESANAMARSSLRAEEEIIRWQNLEAVSLRDGIISAKIISLDNHLWQIDTAARDNSRTFFASISNIVRPEFDYILFSSGKILGQGNGKMLITGNVHAQEFILHDQFIYTQVAGSLLTPSIGIIPLPDKEIPFPVIDSAYYKNLSLPQAMSVQFHDKNLMLTGKNAKPLIIKGIYIVTKNIVLKNVEVHGALISLEGNISVGNGCSIYSEYNFPALASLKGTITLQNNNNPVTVAGLLYAQKIILNGSTDIIGAIYSREQIAFQNSSSDPVTYTLRFNETVLQTIGLHFKWNHLKNLSWKAK